MFHEAAEKDNSPDYAESYKVKIGVWMFLLYLVFYVGFIAVNIISPALMEKNVFLGLNLAVSYGFGLIIFALILALIYNAACTAKEKKMNIEPVGEK